MFFFKTTKQEHKLVDTAEAYNLWDIAKSNYLHSERVLLWKNFAHDKDFLHILNFFLEDLKKDADILEEKMEKYGIKGPDKNRSEVKTAANAEVIRDEYIAQDFYVFLQESVELLLRAFRTSTTNDSIRAYFKEILKKFIDQTDTFVKYLKAKAWLEEPPFYPNVPAEIKEQLDSGEAFHLWEHLTFRYDNIHQTDIYYTFAHDPDFKLILKTGLQDILKKQAQMLEKELTHFGIPLPKRPTNVFSVPSSTQMLDDDHMYRIVLTGMTGAASVHAQALKQCSTNDRVRKMFKDLLYSEIDFIDNFIKFGKTKSWLHPAPEFRLQ